VKIRARSCASSAITAGREKVALVPLLQEIRDLAADPTVPLETVLLRCMVLADTLSDETLIHWVGQELDGYRKPSDLPDYRIAHGQAWADVTNGVRYEKIVVADFALPPEAPADAYQRLNTVYFTDGVRELEVIQGRDDIRKTLDSDLVRYLDQNLKVAIGYWTHNAYIPIPPGAVAGVLGTIRSRVLQYVFRLRKDYPEFDKNDSAVNIPSPTQLNQVFQIAIAQGSAVAIGGGSAYAQNIRQQIVAGDLESLRTYLRKQGVEQEDLDELEVVVAESTPADLNNEQSRIHRWIGNVAEKVNPAGKEIAKTATKELLKVAISYFFGLYVG
jgi:hypothetical protein